MAKTPWFSLVASTKHIDTECALMQIAAYLWECEEIIWAELEKNYDQN